MVDSRRYFKEGGNEMKKSVEKKLFITICLAPAMILLTLFMLYPTINVFMMSMFKWGGLSDNRTFIGLKNFQMLFKDMSFIRALQNTILIIVLVTIVTMAFAILFASILVREKIKGQTSLESYSIFQISFLSLLFLQSSVRFMIHLKMAY